VAPLTGLHPVKAQRSRREQLDLNFHQRRDKKMTARQSLESAFFVFPYCNEIGPPERAVVWFLFVSSLLFVLQTLTGGLIAYYRAEPEGFAVLISRRFSLSASCARGAFSWQSSGSRHLISLPVFYSSAHRETRGWLGDGLGSAIRARTPSTWAGSGRSCSSWACSFRSPTFREI